MLFPEDIQKTMRKLALEVEGGATAEGEIRFSSLYYIPRQMHLSNSQYKSLYECPMSKKDYNQVLIEKLF